MRFYNKLKCDRCGKRADRYRFMPDNKILCADCQAEAVKAIDSPACHKMIVSPEKKKHNIPGFTG